MRSGHGLVPFDAEERAELWADRAEQPPEFQCVVRVDAEDPAGCFDLRDRRVAAFFALADHFPTCNTAVAGAYVVSDVGDFSQPAGDFVLVADGSPRDDTGEDDAACTPHRFVCACRRVDVTDFPCPGPLPCRVGPTPKPAGFDWDVVWDDSARRRPEPAGSMLPAWDNLAERDRFDMAVVLAGADAAHHSPVDPGEDAVKHERPVRVSEDDAVGYLGADDQFAVRKGVAAPYGSRDPFRSSRAAAAAALVVGGGPSWLEAVFRRRVHFLVLQMRGLVGGEVG